MAFGLKAKIAQLAVISMAVVTLAACAPSTQAPEPGSSASDVTIGLTYIPNVQFSPLYVAERDSLFTNAGVAAQLRHHGADEGLFTALTTGQEDVVIASGDEMLQARAQGMDLVSIGSYYSQNPVTVIVPQGSPATSFEDLKGLKIGVPGEYGSSWLGLLAALDSHGMSTSDVTVVPIGYTAQASLVSGKVDAVVGFSNNDLVQFEQSGIAVRSIALTEQEVPLVSVSIITTQQWIDADAERASAVVTAIEAGIQSVVDDQASALDATAKYDTTLTDPAVKESAAKTLAATVKLFVDQDGNVSAQQDLERWTDMATFLASIPGILTADPRLDGAVTNDFVTAG